MKVKFYQGKNEKWYWRVVSSNGRIVADGAEGYHSKFNAMRGFNVARTAIHDIFPPYPSDK